MSFNIKDGTGTGQLAKITGNNRLWTSAISRPFNDNASINGNAYNINTSNINITDSSSHALFYLKNNGNEDVIVESIFVIYGKSTGGSGGDSQITILKNPTAGSIVDSATQLDIVNRNFGSSNILDVNAYKGFEGATLTDGVTFFDLPVVQSQISITLDAESTTIPKGSSFGAYMSPASGNTNLDVLFAITCYTKEEE